MTDARHILAERVSDGVETQETIAAWAAETFGESGSNMRVAVRANEEMAELLRALSSDDASPKALEECADVVIVLFRLAKRLDGDLLSEVQRKMVVNRSRVWNKDGTGHGYHVRDKNPGVADFRRAERGEP